MWGAVSVWAVYTYVPVYGRMYGRFAFSYTRISSLSRRFCNTRYDSVTDGMEATIAIYLGTLLRLVDERRLEIYVHPVVPVLNETRSIVKTFNDIMRKRVRAGDGVVGGSCGCVVVSRMRMLVGCGVVWCVVWFGVVR